MGYVAAAYAVTIIGIGYYWWTLWERSARLSRELGRSRPPREDRG
ncbi:MAG: CcmD family protein [Candidatus Tectomicrobia bacterium]|uniref:CcmD family protein n=1 Tax=Tectimicrobiota bacterium TaxID=2528274 RepID=A0A932I0N6_UNCTE|nr:CcmD family protein [Candidatus Tectomicrobia bacterium]